jgi:prophage regulatory protein
MEKFSLDVKILSENLPAALLFSVIDSCDCDRRIQLEVDMPDAGNSMMTTTVAASKKKMGKPVSPERSIQNESCQLQKPVEAWFNETSCCPDEIIFLRLPDVKAITGLSKTTIYEMIKEEAFPHPVPIGKRAVGWIEAEVKQWAAKQVAFARSDRKSFPARRISSRDAHHGMKRLA